MSSTSLRNPTLLGSLNALEAAASVWAHPLYQNVDYETARLRLDKSAALRGRTPDTDFVRKYYWERFAGQMFALLVSSASLGTAVALADVSTALAVTAALVLPCSGLAANIGARRAKSRGLLP